MRRLIPTFPSMTVQCGGCAVTENANQRGTRLGVVRLFAFLPP
jgi:hypothetical protein